MFDEVRDFYCASQMLTSTLHDAHGSAPTPHPRAIDPVVSPATPSLAAGLAEALRTLGVRAAFGIVGGGIAPVAEALQTEGIAVYHFRHEAGAAFAAVEASLATDRPTVVFVTLGPGLTNAITGIVAARSEGARIVVLSGLSPPATRGRFALQETAPQTLPSDLFTTGALFDAAEVIEDPCQLSVSLSRLAHGLAGPAGFVAHLAIAAVTASAPIGSAQRAAPASVSPPAAPSDIIEAVADRIARCPFFLWIGFGARHAGPALRDLVDLTGAPVVASPRAKGIFPEDDPAYAGVSGLGGHERVRRILRDLRPAHALVLGTRLGEFTSFWRDELLPSEELIHVDVDPTVFGRAYPHARTLGVHAEVHDFVRRLVARLTAMHSPRRRPSAMVSAPTRAARAAPHDGPIRTSFLFDEVQRIVVDQSRALVLAEPGGAFAWGTRRLVFREPSRWRTTMAWASMGHTAAGVVGAALANGRKAVCLVGDGALLMNNEIHTAVRYRAPAVWVVLNNAEYGMVRHAMTAQRMRPVETALGVVDFAAIARAVGASGERVEREGDIAAALGRALESEGPYLVDVVVDPEERGPYMDRVDSLIEQGVVGSDDV